MNSHGIGSLIFEFNASNGAEVLSRLVQQIVQLPPTPKKILAMYYYENLPLAEIAACLGLTEREIDLILAKTVRLLRNNLCRDLEQSKSLDRPPLDMFGSGSPYPWLAG